ncbi:hypothetical protein L596_029140 [Steinernema carpocapsae]|uniref:RNase III domain-containing protein n=1 Tax=Steinernema carpocapsae TaxID=34508 RepID=A0A4U5LTR9_STECR|nr:hypothetical protein L596_029140 [Steinernema carpocapsae]
MTTSPDIELFNISSDEEDDLLDFPKMAPARKATQAPSREKHCQAELSRACEAFSVQTLDAIGVARCRAADGNAAENGFETLLGCPCPKSQLGTGLRHGFYPKEECIPACDKEQINPPNLHHYVLKVDSPNVPQVTRIMHGNKEFVFDGFSLFFHQKLPVELLCTPLKIALGTSATVTLLPARSPKGFNVKSLDWFHKYLFEEILSFPMSQPNQNQCSFYHCLPHFVHKEGKNVHLLPMIAVLQHLQANFKPIFGVNDLFKNHRGENVVAKIRGQVVFNPTKTFSALRLDHVEDPRDLLGQPKLVSFTKWKKSVHTRSRTKRKFMPNRIKSDQTERPFFENAVPSKGYYKTGLYPDVIQHALLLVPTVNYMRFHFNLQILEVRIGYTFKDKTLLELALTHGNFRGSYGPHRLIVKRQNETFGFRTNLDTATKELKRPSSNGSKREPGQTYERLEFLGDAVLGFIAATHLFYMFSMADEGTLSLFKSKNVDNSRLCDLAKRSGLQQFILYECDRNLIIDEGSHPLLANIFEALFGAIYLDGGLNECDRVFADITFRNEQNGEENKLAWKNMLEHPLKRENPHGDRHLIPKCKSLLLLTKFEKSINAKFKHIRVLAKAFSRACIGLNNLTHGSNQRLEFFGDTILQFLTTEFLFHKFPSHSEGALSLLRQGLVNNKALSTICDKLSMRTYIVVPEDMEKMEHVWILTEKSKADLVECM